MGIVYTCSKKVLELVAEKAEYRSQLDGLRAFAALAVFCFSCASITGNVGEQPGLALLGYFGAQLFYTLSGFLIARNLILSDSGHFSHDLKSFYARRFLRIAPLYYLILAGIQIGTTLPQPLLFYAFLANTPALPLTEQSQVLYNSLSTISTEMQFYCLIPFVLIATPLKFRVPLLFLTLFLLNVGQFISQIFLQNSSPMTVVESAQYLLWGCTAGYLSLNWDKLKESNGTFLLLIGVALNLGWVSMVLSEQFAPIHWNSIMTFVRGVGTSLLLLGVWLTKEDILLSVFSNSISVALGRVSYGFFLSHIFVLLYSVSLPVEYRMALSLLLGLALAILSWRYLELPFRRLKRRVFPVPTDEAQVPSLASLTVSYERKDEAPKKETSIGSILESSMYEWIKVAKSSYDSGEYEEARTRYLRAVDLFKDDDPAPDIQIDCLEHLVDVCRRLNRAEESLVYARQRVKVSMSGGGEPYVAALLDLSRSLHSAGYKDQAKIIMLEALRVSNVAHGRPISAKTSTVFNELFPPASDGEILIETEKALKRVPHARQERLAQTMAILAAITLSFVSFGVQTQQSPVFTTSSFAPAREYLSVDGLKQVRFDNGTAASIWDRGQTYYANYETFGMIPFNLIQVLPGLVRKDALFFTVGDDSIVGSDGTVLYKSDAPELRLYQAMLKISYFVNWYYSKYQHYPTNSDWLKERDIWYENPFTQSKQYAAYSDFDPTGEPSQSQAGMIRCRSIGTDGFLITGYGRTGQRLKSGEGSQFFSFELKRGKNLTEDYVHRFDGDITNPRHAQQPVSIYLVDSFQMRHLLAALKALPQLVLPLWFASLATTLLLLRMFRREDGRFLALSAMVIPTLLLILVAIMSLGDR
ncbi:MAG: acyltransferase [Candidatus Obscuribacterales bacterium]|nr:acyltransferase [Candidatus Obscuribacterales bacterium]